MFWSPKSFKRVVFRLPPKPACRRLVKLHTAAVHCNLVCKPHWHFSLRSSISYNCSYNWLLWLQKPASSFEAILPYTFFFLLYCYYYYIIFPSLLCYSLIAASLILYHYTCYQFWGVLDNVPLWKCKKKITLPGAVVISGNCCQNEFGSIFKFRLRQKLFFFLVW